MALDRVIEGALGIADKFIEDKDAKAKFRHELELLSLKQQGDAVQGQIQANIESAKHPSIFVSGMRPAAGWMVIGLLAYNYLGYNLLLFFAAFFPEAVDISTIPQPIEDTTELFYLLGALLGISGFRSIEKVKGVARNSLKD